MSLEAGKGFLTAVGCTCAKLTSASAAMNKIDADSIFMRCRLVQGRGLGKVQIVWKGMQLEIVRLNEQGGYEHVDMNSTVDFTLTSDF